MRTSDGFIISSIFMIGLSLTIEFGSISEERKAHEKRIAALESRKPIMPPGPIVTKSQGASIASGDDTIYFCRHRDGKWEPAP